MNDIELLQYVHETAEMGIEGLNSLDGQVRDDSLRRVLSQQGAEYRQIADQAERLLPVSGRGAQGPRPSGQGVRRGHVHFQNAGRPLCIQHRGDGHSGKHHGGHQKYPGIWGLRRWKP